MSAVTFTNNEKSTSTSVGYAGAVVTVLIWAAWILATRHSAATQLGTIDIGLIRYGIPILVLAPVWLKTGLLPKGVPLAQQQYHALMAEHGVLNLPEEEMAAMAHRIAAALAEFG
mgnify:CR=1 FL=1